ncbi:hypothetical protein V1517DRAFT_334760 [Lipomyces orientalis]|uniref:Uncharacterized protein n=1 Tax=Lipomyces orientalis TaxID=1233043 RepID=A0ACC3TD09_9ASCO
MVSLRNKKTYQYYYYQEEASEPEGVEQEEVEQEDEAQQEDEAEQDEAEQEEEEIVVVRPGERDCTICGLSLYDASALRRHLRVYHGLSVQLGRKGAPKRRRPTIDRREYMRRKYLERKEAKMRGKRVGFETWTITGETLVNQARELRESPIFAHGYKEYVLRTGGLPLLRDLPGMPYRHQLKAIVGDVRAQNIPLVMAFLKNCDEYRENKLEQMERLSWLPVRIDIPSLIPKHFGREEWVDAVHGGLDDFVSRDVLSRAGVGLSVPGDVLLAYEGFVIFDKVWSTECWGLVKTDFTAHVRTRDPAISKSRIAYLGIWLAVPWILSRILFNLHDVVPGSPEFHRMRQLFESGLIGRVAFKFEPKFEVMDMLSAVRVPVPPLPAGFWRPE